MNLNVDAFYIIISLVLNLYLGRELLINENTKGKIRRRRRRRRRKRKRKPTRTFMEIESDLKKSSSPVTSMDQRWSLNGTTALVTGGTKGIGHAIVEELAKFGAIVHTCARNETELNECLKQWEDKNFKVTGSVCDVSSSVQRKKLMEDVSSVFQGKLHILINNAGTGIVKPTAECTAEDYSHIMATNFESALHVSQLAHPLLKASSSGNIVFISTIGTFIVYQGGAIYSASKGAMNQITKHLACEWAKDNIRVNGVAPSVIKTPLIENLFVSMTHLQLRL
ncbi:Short-chain dehydrogenase/reductase SDR protein [Dioscorea alata]|uniref:Short-chain dehydrogenase/reductase SDR protein n=1 Tax=Dioscorea alata TaxID=55571 RepID=A0ACB7VU22_DIOAL|nr:Short-chain dehydrogenase/reductase SDR protein [Dioscorea alata]